MGRSKAGVGQYVYLILPCNQEGLYLDIAQEQDQNVEIFPRKIVPLIHTLIIRMMQKKLSIIYV